MLYVGFNYYLSRPSQTNFYLPGYDAAAHVNNNNYVYLPFFNAVS